MTAHRLAPGPMLPEIADPSRRRWARRLWRAGLTIGLIALLAAFHRPILIAYAGLFRVDDPAPADAILLLLGGTNHRPDRAAEVYREGLAPVVLVGQSVPGVGSLPSETETAVIRLQDGGIPRGAIWVLGGPVTSTRDEAEALAHYAKTHPLKRVIIVTTAFHTARSRWIVRKALEGTGIEVRVAAARHPDFDEGSWYKSDEGLVSYVDETIKTLYYRLRY